MSQLKRQALERRSGFSSLPLSIQKLVADYMPMNVFTASQFVSVLKCPFPYLHVHINLDKWIHWRFVVHELRELLKEVFARRHPLSRYLGKLKEVEICFEYLTGPTGNAQNLALISSLLKALTKAESFHFVFRGGDGWLLSSLDRLFSSYRSKVTVELCFGYWRDKHAYRPTSSKELQLQWLTSLNLLGSLLAQVPSPDGVELDILGRCSNLRQFVLSRTWSADTMRSFLLLLFEKFSESTLPIESVNIWGFRMWDKELRTLLLRTLSLPKSTVRELVIDCPKCETEGRSSSFMRVLTQDCMLYRLDLRVLTLKTVELLGLALAANTSVESVAFSCYEYHVNQNTDYGVRQFFEQLKTNKSLLKLDVRRWDIHRLPEGNFLRHAQHIRDLKLYLRSHEPFELHKLTPFTDSYENLTSLTLRGWKVGDTGAELIADSLLKQRTVLQELDLRMCYIGGKGALAIATCVVDNKALSTLLLSRNFLHDTNTEMLKCLVQNRSLTSLELGRFELEPAGIQALGTLLETQHRLQELRLDLRRWSKITSRVLLPALARNTSLHVLSFGHLKLVVSPHENYPVRRLKAMFIAALQTTNIRKLEVEISAGYVQAEQ